MATTWERVEIIKEVIKIIEQHRDECKHDSDIARAVGAEGLEREHQGGMVACSRILDIIATEFRVR